MKSPADANMVYWWKDEQYIDLFTTLAQIKEDMMSPRSHYSEPSCGIVRDSTIEEFTEEELATETIILLEGQNIFNDSIFIYLKIDMRSLFNLQVEQKTKGNVQAGEYGEILFFGIGRPSRKVRKEFSEKYNLVENTDSLGIDRPLGGETLFPLE